MVVILILGSGLGWIVHRARVQHEAIAIIERAGGKVHYDWQMFQHQFGPTGRLVVVTRPLAQPNLPKWLIDVLGPDYFCTAKRAYVRGSRADESMASVEKLGSLTELNLYSLEIHDKDLVHIEVLTELKTFSATNTSLTGRGRPGGSSQRTHPARTP